MTKRRKLWEFGGPVLKPALGNGMIGGGDDARDKIGTAKKPWYQTNGRPSVAADAGWSMMSNMPNKNWDSPYEWDEDDLSDEEEIEMRRKNLIKNEMLLRQLVKEVLFTEAKKKKKKKKDDDDIEEQSVAGAVAGFIGPLAGSWAQLRQRAKRGWGE